MSVKKTFGIKISEGQKEILDEAVEFAKEVYSTDVKSVAVFSIIYNWFELAKAEEDKGEVIHASEIPDQLEDLCEVGFLQRIIEPKKNIKLWHCLKNQRLYGKGKPILMGDGQDRDSIQKLCEACKIGFSLHEQRSNLGKAKAAIQRFGDMEIEAIINCCIHPANNAIQINLGSQGNFYCVKTDDRATILECGSGQCDYFFKTSAPLYVKDTEAFEEVQKVLE